MINTKEEIGKIYGCYKIVDFIPKQPKEKRYCVCECQKCGSIRTLIYDHVKHRLYKNCSNCKPQPELIKNLVGQKFGKLTVIERAKSNNGKVMYLCKCDCGNERIVQSYHLISNHTLSCGCLQRENSRKAKFKDLLGQKFGQLLVIKECDEKHNGRTSWICKCDCGNITTATTSALLTGKKKSCGCLSSVAEEELALYFKTQKIQNIRQYKFKECRDKKPLPFDFAILDDNLNVKCVIELNGQQHYQPFTYCSEDELTMKKNFDDRVRKDIIKRRFCEINKIPLLEIPYYEFSKKEKICEEFIKTLK